MGGNKTFLPDYTIVGVGRLTGVPLIGESTAINEKVRDVLTYKIMREQYNGRYPSDHYPIYADLIF